KGALTYTDIAGDPVLYGNLPPREISMKDVFRSGDSSKKFKIAEGQWYRYAPSYVSPAYHLLEGFPFYVISSFGGKTSYDADNRPLLVMRSNLWASGYDVDGTDQTSLGQFSGRVQQTYKHS